MSILHANVTQNEHLFVGNTLIEYENFPRDSAPASSVKKMNSSGTHGSYLCMHAGCHGNLLY